MVNLRSKFHLLSYVVTAGLLVTACGDDGTTEDDGSGGSGGTVAGTGGTQGGGGGTPLPTGGTSSGGAPTTGKFDTTCTTVACGSSALIDDFADNDGAIDDENGTMGYWSSWVDPNALGASITSVESAIAGGKLTIEAKGLMGSDGANFGAGLNNLSTVNCGFNASNFTGIEIVGKSLAATAQTVRLRVVMPEVVPVAEGGLCVDKCWGTHFVDVYFDTASGVVTKVGGAPVVWADFKQPEWATQVEFRSERITAVEFANVPNTDGFHIEVTSIGFSGAGGDIGGGGAGNCN